MKNIFKKGDIVVAITGTGHCSTHDWYKIGNPLLKSDQIAIVEDVDNNADNYGFQVLKLNGTAYRSQYARLASSGEIERFKRNTIIGYKCPMNLRGGLVAKDSIYIPDALSKGFYSTKQTDGIVAILEKEIVETWEPVYKKDFLNITLDTSKLDIVIKENGNIEIPKWSVTVTINEIKNLLKILNHEQSFAGYALNIKTATIHVGCNEGPDITKEELETIISEYQKEFK
jgi:hypothetical protein